MPAGISEEGGLPGAPPPGVGFCGKLPSHGDFVRRRVPDAFARRWDEWLDAGIAASRAVLGEAWLDCYLAGPIWRFVVAPGCCGEAAAAGILMPSIDRVGRHYPLTIVAPLPERAAPLSVVLAASEWFRDIESAGLSALVADFRFDDFDARLAQTLLPALLGDLVEAPAFRYSLWWSVDADERPAVCGLYPGLPPSEEFHRLLRPMPADAPTVPDA